MKKLNKKETVVTTNTNKGEDTMNKEFEKDAKNMTEEINNKMGLLSKRKIKLILINDDPEAAFKVFNDLLNDFYVKATEFGGTMKNKIDFDNKVADFKKKHGKVYRVLAVLGSIVKKVAALLVKAIKITTTIVANIVLFVARFAIDLTYCTAKEVKGQLKPLSFEAGKEEMKERIKNAFKNDPNVIITEK